MKKGLRRDARSMVLSINSQQLLGPNTKRFAVIISAPNLNYITLSFGGEAVLNQGINIYALQNPFILMYDHIGDAICEPIFALASAGAPTIGFIDVFWP